MATIAFHADGGYAEVLIDRQPGLRISRNALSAGGPVLARYEDGAWHIGSQRLTRITCQGAFGLEIELSGSACKLGPLTELCLVDDLVVSFDGPLARYHPGENAWIAEAVKPPAFPLAA